MTKALIRCKALFIITIITLLTQIVLLVVLLSIRESEVSPIALTTYSMSKVLALFTLSEALALVIACYFVKRDLQSNPRT